MSRPYVHELTAQEWRSHQQHRERCQWRPCDHWAHHYDMAVPDGRVLVDGVAVSSLDERR